MSSTINHSFDTVCDAIRDVHDEASLWKLSDELVRIAPKGVEAVQKVADEAIARGIPVKSVNTLRLYRDVAIRFPANKRVANVSFSAHREAIAIGDVDQAVRVLTDLAKKHGTDGVSVTTVKQAVQAITGKVPTAKPTTAKVGTSYEDVARDLAQHSGKKFIAELDAMVALSGVTLDSLQAGLNAVLAAVESRKAKAARRAAQEKAKAASAKPAPAKPATGKPAPKKAAARPSSRPVATAAKGKAGDLRDL